MFEWSDRFSINIQTIDSQHQQIFALLNELSLCCKANNVSPSVVEKALIQIKAYSNKHFMIEEKLMQSAKVDEQHFRIHRMEHQSFTYDVNHFSVSGLSQQKYIEAAEKLVCFITNWWIYHILGFDKSMSAQMFAIKNGATPEQAFEQHQQIKLDAEITRSMISSVLDLWRTANSQCRQLEKILANTPTPFSRL